MCRHCRQSYMLLLKGTFLWFKVEHGIQVFGKNFNCSHRSTSGPCLCSQICMHAALFGLQKTSCISRCLCVYILIIYSLWSAKTVLEVCYGVKSLASCRWFFCCQRVFVTVGLTAAWEPGSPLGFPEEVLRETDCISHSFCQQCDR